MKPKMESSKIKQQQQSCCCSIMTKLFLTIFFTIMIIVQNCNCSHQSINVDQMGNYHGIVIGFSNNFQSFEHQYINTTLVSIMNQLQKTSNILKQLIGIQLADVTIILPDKWHINLDDLHASSFNVDQSFKYNSMEDADILYTNDDKSQILTMQYGDCGEGALPINFPMLYVSDENSARLLAHQWIIYRYGVFNEFGLEDDFNYPVYYSTPDGNGSNDNSKSNSNQKPQINSCYQGMNAQFIYSTQCNNATDPQTGRPINPNCDVIPTKNTIQSSFMYAPMAVSSYRLCNSTTHDYQSPTKHNIICDYQSIQDVIEKHSDFERFKPTFNMDQNRSMASIPIKFHILQNKGNLQDESSIKPSVLYALPKNRSKFLETSMETIKKIKYFQHQALFALYGEKFHRVADWRPSSRLSMIFFEEENQTPLKVNLNQLFNDIVEQFKNHASGTCVLFFSGDMLIDNMQIDYIEQLADLFNKKNIRLHVIIYDQIPSNEILKFFDQLLSKMTTKSSVEYAFGQVDGSTSAIAFRTQLVSIINTVLFDMLQHLTEQTHILIKRETVRSIDPAGIEFALDPTIANDGTILIEMTTNGRGSDLALGFQLTDSYRTKIPDITFESYENSIVIQYGEVKSGIYRFNFRSSNPDTFITTSIRVLSKKSLYDSYKGAQVAARCWIQSSQSLPLRVFVQVSQGLNGPVYDADVTFVPRAFTKTQQKIEQTFLLNDDGRGNPDITAHDGIYSAYLNPIFKDYSGSSYAAAYTIMARIVSHNISMKPGNFGNTVLFNSKPRCCGTELKTNGDIVMNNQLERIVHCGSFFYSMQNNDRHSNSNNYAIRDLRIVQVDADNRTINLEWSSPFYSMDQTKPVIIKAFHSYSRHSRLPLEIKESFDREQNEAELEIISNNNQQYQKNNNNLLDDDDDFEQSSVMYETISNGLNSFAAPTVSHRRIRHRHDQASRLATATPLTNSLRQVSIKILSPEEGYYMIAVKERNDENESRPSNIATVFLKSNVLVENNTALAIDNSRLSAGPFRPSRSLPWIQILLICIICALILFIIILVIICFTIKRYRRQPKDQKDQNSGANVQNDFKSSLDSTVSVQKKSDGLIGNDGGDKTDNGNISPKQYVDVYSNQDASANDLMLRNSYDDRLITNNATSSASNHTSCSSVHTVDNGHNAPQNLYHHQQQQRLVEHTPPGSNNGSQTGNAIVGSSSLMKELNVATLLPNSWDAKDLLDHWGRVQEAKLRQESPHIHTQSHLQQSNSPSVLSYGGSSSLDNNNYHHQHNQQQPNSYLFQPAIVQPTTTTNYGQTSQHPHLHHQNFQLASSDYQPLQNHSHPHHQQQSIYSPYSNASSIWQHHQQQQQQQYQNSPYSVGNGINGGRLPLPLPKPSPKLSTSSNNTTGINNFDDNGLPEYSVVRKYPHNISQV